MTTINMKDFYPWYTHDEFVEIPEEIAAELFADRRYHKTHERRMRYNKTYLFDAETEAEAAAVIYTNDGPETAFAVSEQHCALCRALNSLPESQGRRIDAHYILGRSKADIAQSEGIAEKNVRQAIERGLKRMRKYMENNY